MQRSNLLIGLCVAVCLFFATVWFIRRSGVQSAMGGPSVPEPKSESQVQAELAASSNENRVKEVLAEAQRVELSASQVDDFENTLREVRADPKQARAWLLAKRFEKTLPWFAATETALMTCLKGMSRDPKACVPTSEFRNLLDAGVAAGDLTRTEADQYLNELAQLRDPKTRPAMPAGTAGFMEKESQMKVSNMERIAAAVRRVDAAAELLKSGAK